MKVLVVYDSVYGNTEKIAVAVGGAFVQTDEVRVLRAAEVNIPDLESVDLLVVGSPTQAGRPVQAIKEFLSRIPANGLKNVGVTSFDTRFSKQDKGFWIRLVLNIFGYAAGRIASKLQSKGGNIVIAPEGFIVDDTEGPLKNGELERAPEWGKQIRESLK
ncbi:flavodoxin family protein [Chloroflexota bacterium]